jgi:hypothetical protein
MYRFAIDDAAAERLLTGSVDIADAPPPYRAVARTLRALREAPDSWDLAGERDAVEQIEAAVMLERKARPIPPPRRRSSRVAALAATAVVVCALPLVGGLASAGALPEPAQHVASAVLGKVGISVPTSAEAPANVGPPPALAVPGPPSSAPPSADVGGSNPVAGGKAPDAKRVPGTPTPTTPNQVENHGPDTGAGGSPADSKDRGAYKNDGSQHTPGDGSDGGSGSDHER